MWQPLSRGCIHAGPSTTPEPKTSRTSYVSIICHRVWSSECWSISRRSGPSIMASIQMRYGTHLDLNCSKSSFLLFHLTCPLNTWPLHIRGSIIHLRDHVTPAPHMQATFSRWSILSFTLGDLDVLFSSDWRAEEQDKKEKWRCHLAHVWWWGNFLS